MAAIKSFLPPVAPGIFDRDNDPGHPTPGRIVTGPHEQIERQAVERECRSGESGGEIISRPFSREKDTCPTRRTTDAAGRKNLTTKSAAAADKSATGG